ncbi:ribonuclease Z [Bacillus carboniphilus]|uniref:Ribonuclease Z n=1 Tax=Bacillus carboniphilus TaxID=86663 RepID=A0ABY9JWT8_9BACI|nr:ribonuclease Z [Bacillus carboniphilus]WLR43851.1 ribonuclease Z [Bacillus carboniphilus]
MEIQFLGTGAGIPAKERNVSSIALMLLEERNQIWLFDCGEATQHQILHTKIKPRKIEKIFITHLHGDHIFGLPGLLGSRSFQGGEELLTIYGPKGIKEFVETSLSVSTTYLKYPLQIVEIEETGIIFEDDTFEVQVELLEHGIPSYGYRVIEKDLPGKLQVDKLINEGIQPGPIYSQLKDGEKVVLEDGRIINGQDYIGEAKKGRIVTVLGDTRFCQASMELAKDADVLIHEATFSEKEEKLAFNYFHSTTKQAAQVAKRANVGCLWLTHISSRYQSSLQIQSLLQEAKKTFSNTYIANDLVEIDVLREQIEL